MEAGAAHDRPPLDGVRDVIRELDGADPGAVRLTPIPGGASRQTFLVEVGGRRWVLRRDPPGAGSLVSQLAEFGVVEAASTAGVPVPRPLHAEPDGGRFKTAGFLMDYVAGESVAPRLLRKPEYEGARSRLPGELSAALAAIHAIDPNSVGDELTAGADPALAAIEFWEARLDQTGEPLPAVELGLRWLRQNAPDPAPAALVHGDFRLGNFIVSEAGLEAVIDWELAHVGDPAEDIGWLCVRSWRFGNDGLPVAGVGAMGEFLDAYEAAGGVQPEPERLLWWEVLGNVKWAVICALQARDHLEGVRRSHELASLGRRVCEPEWDLLDIIRS
jgi:aminoglycoside phosphotransferase (APT) family kinase protein